MLDDKGRNIQLDVLRGVAILLVITTHAVVWRFNAGVATPLAYVLQIGGWTGVDLFFVLSGFLIGGLLFKEIRRTGTLNVRRFLTRRAFKIWPAYFIFLAFVVIKSVRHAPSVWAGLHPLWPNFVHLQNYFGPDRQMPWSHTWSLAVEEHFYLALPLLLLVLVRFGRMRWIPAITLAVAIGCLGMRLMNWNKPYSWYTQLMPTHLRMDSLLFGVLLAYAYHLKPSVLAFVPRFRILLFVAGLALIAPMFCLPMESPFVFTFGYTMNYLGYGCILIACVDADTGPLARVLTSRPARAIALIGFFSYSIYLWHLVAREQVLYRLHAWGRHGAAAYLLMTGADIALAILFGVISALLIEQPFLWLRNRLFPSRTPAGPVMHPAPARGELQLAGA